MTDSKFVLTPGTQVIYIPPHANGREDHPNSEDGFVTSSRMVGEELVAWCRFWSKYQPNELRTRANSEPCFAHHLVIKDTRPQAIVDAMLEIIR
jgi:hypothetical protein